MVLLIKGFVFLFSLQLMELVVPKQTVRRGRILLVIPVASLNPKAWMKMKMLILKTTRGLR